MSGRAALVSGASKGIGRAVAAELGRRGYAVALCARGEEQLATTAGELARDLAVEVLPVVADFSRRDDIDRAVEAVMQQWGRLDVLVNNAGGSPFKPFVELSDEDWQGAIDLKFLGYARAARAVLDHMTERGSGVVVNVVGTTALQAAPNLSVAGSLCAALVYLTKTLALEVGGSGVRVNAVSPGPTATDRLERAIARAASDGGITVGEAEASVLAQIPLGRAATPSDVAVAVAFLASDEAAYLTGINLVVDGGMTRAV